jgi:D-serine deaminase-like pyridoxal phosphate-dependent protein
LAASGVRLRPHFKAHKCTRLMARQVGPGRGEGVTCATAHEAEVLARAGFDDLLVANEVADPGGLAALERAAARADVTVCVDDPRHVELLRGTSASLGVLVEIDVGQHRCGLAPGDPALVDLARLVTATPDLRFRGLQGYVGHAVLLPDRDERARHVDAAAAILRAERARLEAAGLPCELISGGGTGTLDLGAGALDEVQAGSYVLMDSSYGALDLGFEQALFCRATVVSRRGDRLVLDAGLKALSAEYGMPRSADESFEVESLADEHAVARVGSDVPLGVGDGVLVVPAHVDPTVNLHAVLHVIGEDGVVEIWPVDGRRT